MEPRNIFDLGLFLTTSLCDPFSSTVVFGSKLKIELREEIWFIKFIYSEKATKFCSISTLLLSYVVPVKSKVEISQNFVAFQNIWTLKELTVDGIYLKTWMMSHQFGPKSCTYSMKFDYLRGWICVEFLARHSRSWRMIFKLVVLIII